MCIRDRYNFIAKCQYTDYTSHPCTDKVSPEKSTALRTRVTALKCTDIQTVSVQSPITQTPVSYSVSAAAAGYNPREGAILKAHRLIKDRH